jgi:hypothetical protein
MASSPFTKAPTPTLRGRSGATIELLFFIPLAGMPRGAGDRSVARKLPNYGIDDQVVQSASDKLNPAAFGVMWMWLGFGPAVLTGSLGLPGWLVASMVASVVGHLDLVTPVERPVRGRPDVTWSVRPSRSRP